MVNHRQQKVILGGCFMFVFLVAYIHHDTIEANIPASVRKQLDGMRYQLLNSTRKLSFMQNLSMPSLDSMFVNTSLFLPKPRPKAFIPRYLRYSIPIAELSEEQKKLKIILIWHFAYGEKSMEFGYGQEPFEAAKCKERRCLVTGNRNLLPIDQYDAVLMHFRGLRDVTLPSKRSPKQRWIFYEMESATYIYEDPRKYDGLFNWTATYRSDSDIWSRYGIVVKRDTPLNKPPFDLSVTVKKTKQAAWFVSNCRSMSWRENLVKEMGKLMKIDIYGSCGPLKCKKTIEKTCDDMLERDYKFYLSFENSYCKDYVTEKLFRILRHQVIPVVYGNNEYEKMAPEGSYIDIRDFEDTKALTDYLKYLDKNITAYNEYFEWKKNYRVLDDDSVRASLFCDICEKLHTDNSPKVYKNLMNWFIEKGECSRFQPLSMIEKLLGTPML